MKPTNRPSRDLVAMGIGLVFSIASTGCAFLVDFGYEEAGQGGGATSSGVSATGAGGASGACVSECGECLAPVTPTSGAPACATFDDLWTFDAGYTQSPGSVRAPSVSDFVADSDGAVFTVGTYGATLETNLGAMPNATHPSGFVLRTQPNTLSVGRRLVGCDVDATNQLVESDAPLFVTAAARYRTVENNAEVERLVVAGTFGAERLLLVDSDLADDPCKTLPDPTVAQNPMTAASGVAAPFLLWFDATDLGFESSDVFSVDASQSIAYFADVDAVDERNGEPGYVVALGVATGQVRSSRTNATADQLDGYGQGLPEYFLYATDGVALQGAIAPLDAGPCAGLDDNLRPHGLDAAVDVARENVGARAWFGLTGAKTDCLGETAIAAAEFGHIGVARAPGSPGDLQFPLGKTVLTVPASNGNDVTISKVLAIQPTGPVLVAGALSGAFSYEGNQVPGASDDGFVLAFDPMTWEPEKPPLWSRRISGDRASPVAVGGLAHDGKFAYLAATIPPSGALGSPGGSGQPPERSWCYPDDPNRVLVVGFTPSDGALHGANVLGNEGTSSEWSVGATALLARSGKATVAMGATGTVGFLCSTTSAMNAAHASFHLRTLTFE